MVYLMLDYLCSKARKFSLPLFHFTVLIFDLNTFPALRFAYTVKRKTAASASKLSFECEMIVGLYITIGARGV